MYMSERHQEGLAHLLYGINMGGGFVALTGEVGTGKTTLCRCLLEQLPDKVDIALILNPKLNVIELLSTICDELGIGDGTYRRSLKNFIDQINSYLLNAYSKGRKTVLLIDEAQNLSLEVLELIRLLTNLETSKAKLLQIVLVGQPELKELLSRKELRQLNQRITARYHLLPLSFDETRAYIQHRLAVCHGDPSLFKDSAIRKVYQLSGGIPRVINVVCDRALLGAYATNAHKITPAVIRRAARETVGLSRYWWMGRAIAATIFLGSLGGGMYLLNPLAFNFPQTQPLAPKNTQPVASTLIEKKQDPVAVVEPPSQLAKPEVEPFDVWLDNPQLSLQEAVRQALAVWKVESTDDRTLSCESLPASLQCFIDKANWKGLLELDRPAILEFSLDSEDKRYALFLGIDKGQAVIHFNEDLMFPIVDIMKYWNGNFLILWQPPLPEMMEIGLSAKSDNVLWLRRQLSLIVGEESNDELSPIFDQTLKAQVIDFQQTHQLTPDGIVGVRTLIHLENASKSDHSPHLKITN